MLGFSRDALLSTPLSAIHPHDLPALEAFAASVFQLGSGWTNELTCVTTMISRWRPRSTFWTGLAHTGD